MILHQCGCHIAENHRLNYHVYLLLLLLCFVQSSTAQTGYQPPQYPDSFKLAPVPNNYIQPPPDSYNYNEFRYRLFLIFTVLMISMTSIGILSLCLRFCAACRRGIEPVIMGSGRTQRTSGLDPAVVENFPTLIYSSVVKAAYSIECPVCLSEFRDDDMLRLLPKCNHVFHLDCIDAWLVAHTTCPVCRSDLIPESDQVAVASVDIPDLDGELDEVSRRPNMGDEQNQVSVCVNEDQSKELPASDV